MDAKRASVHTVNVEIEAAAKLHILIATLEY